MVEKTIQLQGNMLLLLAVDTFGLKKIFLMLMNPFLVVMHLRNVMMHLGFYQLSLEDMETKLLAQIL